MHSPAILVSHKCLVRSSFGRSVCRPETMSVAIAQDSGWWVIVVGCVAAVFGSFRDLSFSSITSPRP